MLVIALVPIYQVTAQEAPEKERRDVLTTHATWNIGSENGIDRTVFLFADKSSAGVEIFIIMTTDSGDELFGKLVSEDRSIFTVKKNLGSAVLSPISIDACYFDQLDENGICTEVIETLEVQAEWTATSSKSTTFEKHVIGAVELERVLSHGSARVASAVGSVDDIELGDDFSAAIARSKLLVVNYGELDKPPRLDLFGNKGTFHANAFWQEVALNSETANVALRVVEAIRGATSVEVQIILQREDGTSEFFKGKLEVTGGSEDIFSFDMRKAVAKLDPVAITVCHSELDGQCSSSPSQTFTISAEWDGIENSASLEKVTSKSRSDEFSSRVGYSSVGMFADATGSIDGNSMGQAEDARLFHFSNVRAEFK
jgi:hypothetical protein